MTAPPSARPGLWSRAIAPWLVVLLALGIYAPTVTFNNIGFDDDWLWASDSPLRTPSVALAHRVFFDLGRQARRPLGSEYLPVRDVSVAIDMAIWGEDEHGPHITELVLVAATVLALGFLLIRMGVPPPIAWIGTMLWTAHPLHVETVAWVSERKGVLAALLVFALGHAWWRYRDPLRSSSRWWLVAAVLAGVAATWSKAPAMFAPAAFAALDLLLLPAGSLRWRRWIAIACVGGAVGLAALPVIKVASEVGVVGVSEGGHAGRFTTALGVHGHYLQSLTLARAPSLSYPISTDGPGLLDITIGAIGLGVLLALAVWLWRIHARVPAARWGLALLAWAAVWFLPISHLLAPIHITVADRYAYLWSLAPCLALAWGLSRFPPPARALATAVLTLGLAIMAIRAEQAWTNSLELFGRAFATNPDDPQVCENLAIAWSAAGSQRKAVAVLDAGLALRPGAPYLLERKSQMLEIMGDHVGALDAERTAAASGFGTALAGYATLLERDGQYDAALPYAERAVLRHPESEPYARLDAEILIALGRQADARPLLERALAIAPNSTGDHLMLAKVLIQLRQPDAALPHLDAAAHDPMLANEVTTLRQMMRTGTDPTPQSR